MHVVIWTSKDQRYATPSSSVIEVIPFVQSRPVPESESWLTGLFDYRGSLLPLIDSSRLLGHDASDIRMATRILVIRVSEDRGEHVGRVGLIVERVLGSESLDFDGDAAFMLPTSSGVKFLGPVAITADATVQLTIPSRLPTGRE